MSIVNQGYPNLKYLGHIIDDIDEQSIIQTKLYPNPCTGLVFLELDTKARVCITNVNGLLVRQINDFKNKHIIDLINEAQGMYFIKIVSDDQISVLKLLKE
ncbi:MAG: T9SS type A sorting domain-containing protein [Bacteroidales bacterium]|nr:T9SS type A sorting domain-containing protein [Bacteroidales bacterium]